MEKKLVYKIEIATDPATANPGEMLAALKPYGTAKIVGSSMKKAD